jgi:hypothetical protein
VARRCPSRRAISGSLLLAGGLTAALVALSPTAGVGTGPSTTASITMAGVWLLVSALAVAPWRRGRVNALGVAVCTGLGYGLSATQLKEVALQFTTSPVAPLGHPALYLACLVGGVSIVLSQIALRQADDTFAVVPVLLVVDPLVGVVAGPLWFGERLTVTPASVAVVAIAAVAMLAGIRATRSVATRSVATRSGTAAAPEQAAGVTRRRRQGASV